MPTFIIISTPYWANHKTQNESHILFIEFSKQNHRIRADIAS